MSTLLTKPVSEITFDDVYSYCNPATGASENQMLEYKGGGKLPGPKDIGKAASAFANTFGGTLILGVDEDHQSGRPKEISGIPVGRELEKQICSILLDNITPPLVPMPEIRIVELRGDPARVVVVIRIPQSNATPHAAYDKNQHQHVYVRIGSESRPTGREDWEVPASIEKLEWLFGHRKRSEKLRDRIRDEALDRTEMYYERRLFPHFVDHRPQGQGTFSIVPLYPQGPIAAVQELYGKCVDTNKDADHKLVVHSKLDGGEFPLYGLMQPRTTQNSVIGFSEFGEHAIRSFEFNVSGMLLYQETFGYGVANGPAVVPTLDFQVVCSQLGSFLELAAQFYNEVKPVGLLQFHVDIGNIDGLCMLPPNPNGLPMRVQPKDVVPYQRAIDCERVVRADLLRDDRYRDELLLELLCEIGNAFNWDQGLVQKVFERR